MRAAVLLCCLAAALALPADHTYIDGEFMLRIDEAVIRNEAATNRLISQLKTRYNFEVLKNISVGKLRFLKLSGDDVHMAAINNMHGVKYIERNTIAQLFQTCQENPSPGTWGLDRIDQRAALPYNDPESPDATYIYGERTGDDVVAYIIDTGIDYEISEFSGRASWGFQSDGLNPGDGHGHGTHCAGTVGADSYGVAKGVALVAVKVVNNFGFGSSDQFVEGMQYVIDDHLARQESLGAMPKSVASASLGYSPTQSIDDSVQEGINAGVVFVAAAGNNDGDACNISPARVADAITVGASDVNDVSASFSNYGSCVDVYAPGVDVLSCLPGGGSDAWSGTSMACPHAAGVVARYQSAHADAPTPAQVSAYIVSEATEGALTWFNDRHSESENLLLYSDC